MDLFFVPIQIVYSNYYFFLITNIDFKFTELQKNYRTTLYCQCITKYLHPPLRNHQSQSIIRPPLPASTSLPAPPGFSPLLPLLNTKHHHQQGEDPPPIPQTGNEPHLSTSQGQGAIQGHTAGLGEEGEFNRLTN